MPPAYECRPRRDGRAVAGAAPARRGGGSRRPAGREPRDPDPGAGPSSERSSLRRSVHPLPGAARRGRARDQPIGCRWADRAAASAAQTVAYAPRRPGPSNAMGAEGAKRPGLCERSSRARDRPGGHDGRRSRERSEQSVVGRVEIAGVSTQWERGSEATRSLRAKPRAPRSASGARAATAPSERSRANAPASASERRHGTRGPRARGGIKHRAGGAASRRPRGCRRPAGAGPLPAGRGPSGPAARRGHAGRGRGR